MELEPEKSVDVLHKIEKGADLVLNLNQPHDQFSENLGIKNKRRNQPVMAYRKHGYHLARTSLRELTRSMHRSPHFYG